MAGKTFQDFLDYRNRELAKLAGSTAKGYHVFNNETAKAIFDIKPTNKKALAKIKGFPLEGERMKKYGDAVIQWFMTSSVFGKK